MIDELGPRPSGGAQEHAAAEWLVDRLVALGAMVHIEREPARLGFVRTVANLMVGAYLLGLLLYPWVPLAAALLAATLVGAFLAMRRFGNGVLDWMMARGEAWNVLARVPATEPPRRILVFSAHHDSAEVMPLFSSRLNAWLLVIETAAALGLATLVPAGIARAIQSGVLPGWVPPMGWYDGLYPVALVGFGVAVAYRAGVLGRGHSPGANDNLSSVSVLLGLAEHMRAHPPAHTEVWLVSFGCEETGTYGSAGFARRHPGLIREALFVNLETVGSGELAVWSAERSSGVTYTPEVVALLQRAALTMGLDLPAVPMGFGLTDAGSLVRAGGRAACLAAGDERYHLPLRWHARDDVAEALDEAALQRALAVCVAVVGEVEGEEGGG